MDYEKREEFKALGLFIGVPLALVLVVWLIFW